jgi:uncharacterized membrane protein
MVTAAETASKIGVHMGISFGIMYMATGSIAFGGLAAILEPICTVLLMPFHEKLWERIRANLKQRQPADIGTARAGSARA